MARSGEFVRQSIHVRRGEFTHADEVERHARLIALLGRRPAIGKLQRVLDAIADLWSPPDHEHACMVPFMHWRVQPSGDDVRVVAEHYEDPRTEVRRAVLVALKHASPHGDAACKVVEAGLAHDDACVRMQAARAAHSLELGAPLTSALRARLDDVNWNVRWHAAAALAPTDFRAQAVEVLLTSEPRPDSRALGATDDWRDCLRRFADVPAARARLGR